MVNPLTNAAYLLPPLVASAIGLVLMIIVWRSSRRGTAANLFCGVLASVAAVSFLIYTMRSSTTIEQALLRERLIPVIYYASFVLFYHFTLVYTGNRGQRGLLAAAYVSVIVVALASPTPLVIKSMYSAAYGYAPIMGALGKFAALGNFAVMGGGIYNLARRYRTSSSFEERNHLVYIIIAVIFPLIGAFMDAFTSLPPAAIWSNIVFVSICSVAVLKYHLLEIRIVARNTLTYLLVSLIVAVPYLSALFIVNEVVESRAVSWWIHAAAILILGFMLKPVHGWAQWLVDKAFFGDRYDYLKALEQFGKKAQSIINISELGSTMVELAMKALRCSGASLLLSSNNVNGFVVVASTSPPNMPNEVVLSKNSVLVRWLAERQSTVSSQEIEIIPQLRGIAEREKGRLAELDARLLVPIKSGQSSLSGILVLSDKLSRFNYSAENKRLLLAIAGQMGMALENSRLYAEAIRAQENLETWLNGMTDGVIIVETSNKVRFMNRAAINRFGNKVGYTCIGLLGKTAMCPGCPIHGDTTAIKTALHYRAKIGGAYYDIAAAPLVNADGSTSIVEVFRDVSEQMRIEDALRESERRYRLLADNATDVIWTVDMKLRPSYVSPSIQALLGYGVEEALGLKMSELFAPDSFALANRLLLEELKNEKLASGELSRYRTIEIELCAKSGALIPVEVKFSFLRDATEQPIGILAIARDISERRRAEASRRELEKKAELASRLATVGEMAAGIAHEINNPLTGVIGFAGLLKAKDLPDDVKKQVELINTGAERVANIVRRLLTYARQQKPQRTMVNINDILANTLELRAYAMQSNNIQVKCEFDSRLPFIAADASQIQQVFLNIILNAETEMRLAHGKGNLLVKTKLKERSIKITFRDDGPGISPENIQKVFDPFFTTREVGQGTGLGLSVCHGIVTEHGGRIYVESEMGKGATFFVELPISPQAGGQSVAEKNLENVYVALKSRVLVVDDEPIVQSYLNHVLAKEGHQVDICDNGREALAQIKRLRYDVILLDIKMPGLNGIELFNRIKGSLPDLVPRIIFITGDTLSEDTRGFLDKSGISFIAKPISLPELREKINNILEKTNNQGG